MPQPPNYRHLKRRREEAQKKEQLEREARRGRVRPAEPEPAPGTEPPRRGPT